MKDNLKLKEILYGPDDGDDDGGGGDSSGGDWGG